MFKRLPFVVDHCKAIYKISVTGGSVKKRIANAKKAPTYLLADVEIVAEYKLANINRKALEAQFLGGLLTMILPA